jgi:WD40 repeat protein
LIYATARIVVLAFIKINRQAHYTTHESEIISLCEWNGLIASGELADNPVIHLWKADTQRTKKVLRGCHKRGIYLLKFASEGKLLFSCGLQP